MCLLLFKPAGKSVPFEYIENAAAANPDGMGLSFADGDKVHIKKNIKWGVQEFADEIDKLEDFPLIGHFRLASLGSVCQANLHPFPLPKQWTAGHNGMIDTKDLNVRGDETDTSAFLREVVAPIIKRGADLTSRNILSSIEARVGNYNKLAFLHGSGEYGIANEDCGLWRDGVWYSNYSFENYEYSFQQEYKSTELFKYNSEELECSYCGRLTEGEFFIHGLTMDCVCEECERNYFI